jgi:hypothetical protein
MKKYIIENDSLIFECQWCDELIIVHKNEINCGIFRHGVYKNSLEQINPHLNKLECDNLSLENKIYGCGKPFKIVREIDFYFIMKCDYI